MLITTEPSVALRPRRFSADPAGHRAFLVAARRPHARLKYSAPTPIRAPDHYNDDDDKRRRLTNSNKKNSTKHYYYYYYYYYHH